MEGDVTRMRLAGAGAALIVLVAVMAFGGWYFFIRDPAPPEVNLEDAVSAAADATETPDDGTATPEGTAGVPGTATPSNGGDDGGGEPAGLVGDWVLADGSESFVGYRVVEELARIGTATAVGRTSDITATLTYDGSAITAVEIEANLQALQSDDDRRDGQLEKQAIETGQFPTSTFSLTEPIAIAGSPGEGETVAATAVGDLTLHGVTRQVAIDLEGQLVGDRVVVVGSTEIQFADYDIDSPTSMAVLSVEDHGVMEFQLIFVRA
jgi:polyisoprenoid-binding protein YceI